MPQPSSRRGFGAAGKALDDDEARGTGASTLRAIGRAAAARGGSAVDLWQPRHDGAQRCGPRHREVRPMPRSISAPTIAGCWWRARRGDGFRVVDAFSRIIRLGEGISATGRLSEPAIDRAIEALGICRDKMRNRGVTRARLIATEACRAADNGAEFLARVADEVGLDLEIVDRETEAALAATGCTPLVDPRGRRRDPVRHRRRLVGDRPARSVARRRGAGRRCRRSRPGPRCRSAW